MSEMVRLKLACGCAVDVVDGFHSFLAEIGDECMIHGARYRHTLDEDEVHDR